VADVRRSAPHRSRRELRWSALRKNAWLPYLCFLGVLGMFASQLLLAHGLKLAGGIDNAVVLGQLVPVYTCVIGVFRLQVCMRDVNEISTTM